MAVQALGCGSSSEQSSLCWVAWLPGGAAFFVGSCVDVVSSCARWLRRSTGPRCAYCQNNDRGRVCCGCTTPLLLLLRQTVGWPNGSTLQRRSHVVGSKCWCRCRWGVSGWRHSGLSCGAATVWNWGHSRVLAGLCSPARPGAIVHSGGGSTPLLKWECSATSDVARVHASI
jgi:hypothetical protein